MCGIAGAFAIEGALDRSAQPSVRRMTDALAHRGPDGDGFFNDACAALGHRRLAIIDVARGQQPLSNEDGSVWITFNGEIYNYRSLRRRLESAGHRYRTASDTETIVHAYEEFGEACVDHIDGQFAFVIYDAKRRQLFAARDRLGKKPFFYTTIGHTFYFASELPALTHVESWRGDLDTSAIEGYLTLGYIVEPATIYRGVHKLESGCWLRIRDGQIHTRRYWDIQEFDTDRRPTEEILKDIDETLATAVRDRLESEVPLGAFLSGGIDSGLVVSYMADAMTTRLVTTSVGFGDGDGPHNELAAAGITAAHFKSEHYVETIEPHLDATLDRVVMGLGEPMADASAIPTWYVSAAARRHVTVALSGDGGDETFAGYDFRYVPHAMEAKVRPWVPGFANPLLGAVGAMWPRASWVPRPLRLRTILQNLAHDPAGAYYRDLAFLKPEDTNALMGVAPDRDPTRSNLYQQVTEPYRRCPSSDALQRAEYADLKIYLPNDPLVKVDRMSMAHALEVRCPLLDRRVVELAFRIPASQKQQSMRGKVLLRELARRRLPGELWHLPKKGFTAPVDEWVAKRYRAKFRDEVLATDTALRQHLDWQHLNRCFEEHVSGRRNHSYALWAVWILERWLRQQTAGPRQEERMVPVPA